MPSPNSKGIYALATGLLVLMAALYALARSLESAHPLWSWVRAFAEAGMVGALADWFAVVALFRHPLGWRIPHTAIIPNSKDQIAENLARFVQEHFLGPEQIVERLRRLRVAERFASWLAERDHAELVAEKVADGLPALLDKLDDLHMRSFLRESVLSLSDKVPAAPLAGRLVEMLMDSGQHEALLDEGLIVTKKLLDENEDFIAGRIEAELRKIPDLFSLKTIFVQKVAGMIVRNLQNGADEIAKDPHHPFRRRFHDKLEEVGHRLCDSPEWHEKAEDLKRAVLTNPALTGSLDALWSGVKEELAARLAVDHSSQLRSRLADFVQESGLRLQADAEFQEKLDGWIRDGVESLVRSHGHEIGSLIRDTVRRWDGHELASKLEAQVGADLQYIRINGTLVGGIVGLLLHGIGHLLW